MLIIAEYTAYQECIEKIEAYQKKEEQTSKEENQLPYNSSMLVLFFHFFLKSIGVDMGQAIKGNIARFIHLLFNLNYVSLTKTKKIYDKVRASPLVVEDSTLVGYLAEAKNTFLKFDLKDASLMVDEYLTESIKEKNKKN